MGSRGSGSSTRVGLWGGTAAAPAATGRSTKPSLRGCRGKRGGVEEEKGEEGEGEGGEGREEVAAAALLAALPGCSTSVALGPRAPCLTLGTAQAGSRNGLTEARPAGERCTLGRAMLAKVESLKSPPCCSRKEARMAGRAVLPWPSTCRGLQGARAAATVAGRAGKRESSRAGAEGAAAALALLPASASCCSWRRLSTSGSSAAACCSSGNQCAAASQARAAA